MLNVAAERELYRSCEILFGPELSVSRDFLETSLQVSGVKTAYRQRVRETHPDMFATADAKVQRRNTDLFRAVQEAYEKLNSYLQAREKGYRFPRQVTVTKVSRTASRNNTSAPPQSPRPSTKNTHSPSGFSDASGFCKGSGARNGFSARAGFQFYRTGGSGPAPNNQRTESANLYKGPLPQRKLLFGHYLYFSGVISWRHIIQALIWQRTQRPRLGELARRFGWLSDADIQRILLSRPILQPFGETAKELGMLQEPQLQQLITAQRRMQKKIGAYFIENNILTPAQFNELLSGYFAHNARNTISTARSEFRASSRGGSRTASTAP